MRVSARPNTIMATLGTALSLTTAWRPGGWREALGKKVRGDLRPESRRRG